MRKKTTSEDEDVHKEPVWKKRKIIVDEPYCPYCGNRLTEEKNLDCQTLWSYFCDKCDYKH